MPVRHVKTPEGSRFYGKPIGSPITPSLVAAAKASGRSMSGLGVDAPTRAELSPKLMDRVKAKRAENKASSDSIDYTPEVRDKHRRSELAAEDDVAGHTPWYDKPTAAEKKHQTARADAYRSERDAKMDPKERATRDSLREHEKKAVARDDAAKAEKNKPAVASAADVKALQKSKYKNSKAVHDHYDELPQIERKISYDEVLKAIESRKNKANGGYMVVEGKPYMFISETDERLTVFDGKAIVRFDSGFRY